MLCSFNNTVGYFAELTQHCLLVSVSSHHLANRLFLAQRDQIIAAQQLATTCVHSTTCTLLLCLCIIGPQLTSRRVLAALVSPLLW